MRTYPIKKMIVKAKNHCIPWEGSIGVSPVAGKRTTSVSFGFLVLSVTSGGSVGVTGVSVTGGSVGVTGVSVTGGSVGVTGVSVTGGSVGVTGGSVGVMPNCGEAVASWGRANITADSIRAVTTRRGRIFFDMVIPPVNQFLVIGI
jgi:hypothetical protein